MIYTAISPIPRIARNSEDEETPQKRYILYKMLLLNTESASRATLINGSTAVTPTISSNEPIKIITTINPI